MKSLVFLLCFAFGFPLPAADNVSHFASYHGIKVHYESYGRSAQREPALVFIHGWTCDLTFWRGQEPVYTRRHSLLIDLPGHGRSDKPRGAYPMEYFARAVDAVMQDAGVQSAVLIGHSLGGPIAYAFLREHSDRAVALVLVDAEVRPGSAGPLRPEVQRQQMAARARSMAGPAGDRNFSESIESMFSEKTTAAVRAEIRTRMLATPRHVRIAALTSPSSLLPPSPKESFPLPALAIQASSLGMEERFGIMKTLFPAMRLEAWEGSGHFLMMEEPERFNRSLEAFLTGIP